MTRYRPPRLRPGLSFPRAVEKMRAGGLLRLQYVQGKPVWEIGDLGVDPETVALLISCKEIEPADDALFIGAPSQTWRLCSVK
jgi:hypothetical protein